MELVLGRVYFNVVGIHFRRQEFQTRAGRLCQTILCKIKSTNSVRMICFLLLSKRSKAVRKISFAFCDGVPGGYLFFLLLPGKYQKHKIKTTITQIRFS